MEQPVATPFVDDVVIEGQGAERVRALLQMGKGKLSVEGGADTLFRGRFEYGAPQWKPEVHYTVTDGVGHLQARGPQSWSQLVDDPRYVWDLALGDQLPLGLTVHLGSGEANLNLSDTRLEGLDAAVGSGRFTADLSGDMPDLEQVSLKTGSGVAAIVLRGRYASLSDVGISLASGDTDLVLDGSCPRLKQLKVSGASGRMDVHLGGDCPALERVALNTASGVMTVDLTSGLVHDLAVGLNCVSGVGRVIYPETLGIALRFTAVSGRFDAPGFTRSGDQYTNSAYRDATVRVHITMSSVSGKLTVQPAAG